MLKCLYCGEYVPIDYTHTHSCPMRDKTLWRVVFRDGTEKLLTTDAVRNGIRFDGLGIIRAILCTGKEADRPQHLPSGVEWEKTHKEFLKMCEEWIEQGDKEMLAVPFMPPGWLDCVKSIELESKTTDENFT